MPESGAEAGERGSQAQHLEEAFLLFNRVSAELTQAYDSLQAQVARLTAELAEANGKLRRQYEETQALSERLSLLLDALPGGVVVIDQQGRVVQDNPAARGLFACNLAGALWADVASARLRPTATPGEWSLSAPDGLRHLGVAASPIDSAGGQILLIHDLTEAVAMKASVERNQRLAAMGEMAASLAHQLRTPLAAALLYTSQLGSPDLGQPERARFADKATARLKHLEQLIRDVLLFARGEAIGREAVPAVALAQEVAQTLEPLMRERGLAFRTDFDGGGKVIMGERKAIAGALTNLLENAMQACPGGGCIEFALRPTASGVAYTVRDNGPGIPEAIAGRLFDPFFTTRDQGTGLGLAIVRGVARAHGGDVTLQSRPGEGAAFTLSLPAGASDAVYPTPVTESASES